MVYQEKTNPEYVKISVAISVGDHVTIVMYSLWLRKDIFCLSAIFILFKNEIEIKL